MLEDFDFERITKKINNEMKAFNEKLQLGEEHIFEILPIGFESRINKENLMTRLKETYKYKGYEIGIVKKTLIGKILNVLNCNFNLCLYVKKAK